MAGGCCATPLRSWRATRDFVPGGLVRRSRSFCLMNITKNKNFVDSWFLNIQKIDIFCYKKRGSAWETSTKSDDEEKSTRENAGFPRQFDPPMLLDQYPDTPDDQHADKTNDSTHHDRSDKFETRHFCPPSYLWYLFILLITWVNLSQKKPRCQGSWLFYEFLKNFFIFRPPLPRKSLFGWPT